MAARNADSMTNAQGEFHPSKPRAEPAEKGGHQIGQQVGNDALPEFHAQTLPPGSAPPANTFQPNPIDETPGQADNDLANRQHGKEQTTTGALDMPGATSADVHTGLGHPGQGQTSTEIRHEGQHTRKKDGSGGAGLHEGGSGLHGDLSVEAKRLQSDHHPQGNKAEQRDVFEGAEDKAPVTSEELAAEGQREKQQGYDKSSRGDQNS